MFILNRLVEFHRKLQDEDEEIISLLETNIRSHNLDEELHIISAVTTTEAIIMDLITDLLQSHYDARWIISNTNNADLIQRLSKQKEQEKQTLIHKLDTMGDDKRASTMELQRMGDNNQFKTSSEELGRYVQSNERQEASDAERYNTMNSIFEGTSMEEYVTNISNGEVEEHVVQPVVPVAEDVSYINEDEIDEDGEMGDELHDFYEEESLNNDFNE